MLFRSEKVGLPEARLSLAQAIIFLCESPKSNSVLMAVDAAYRDAQNTYDEPVPVHLRDTSYAGAKDIGAGKGYKYPHNFPGHWVKQSYRPANLEGVRYYIPTEQGSEKAIRENHKKRGLLREE